MTTRPFRQLLVPMAVLWAVLMVASGAWAGTGAPAHPGASTDHCAVGGTLSHLVETYRGSGDLRRPLADPLTNLARQVRHHIDADRPEDALDSLAAFTDLLDNPALAGSISDEARDALAAAAADLETFLRRPLEATHDSTGTVVVKTSVACEAVHVVGTSTIVVHQGTTVDDVLAQVVAKDNSAQVRTVVDADEQPKPSGTVAGGDRLEVVAEDGEHTFAYALALYDPGARLEAGDYWDEDLYYEIDETVNANTPVFPANYCDITDDRYAEHVRLADEVFAIGNEAGNPIFRQSPLVYTSREVWYYGDAIHAAIADCHEAGGGIVVLPAGGSLNDDGAYYSGAVWLQSNINLRIDEGATLRFMRNKTNEYYPVVLTSYEGTDLYNFSPLLYALNATDIAITGGGLLHGGEDMWNWRPWKKGYWGEYWFEDRDPECGFGCQGLLNTMNYGGVPVNERIFSHDGSVPETIPVIDGDGVAHVPPPDGVEVRPSAIRPTFFGPNASRNILIDGVQIRHTPFWIVHSVEAENLLIRNLDIYSNKTIDFESSGWNNDDGINPESGTNVVIERNDVTVSDDGVALKSGRNRNGRELRTPVESVIIRDSRFWNDGGGSAGISAGSEMSGGVRDVFIHDNDFGGNGLSLILKLKKNSFRGGYIENIRLRDNTLHRAISGMIEFDPGFGEVFPVAGADIFDPIIRNIWIDNTNTAPTIQNGRRTFNMLRPVQRAPISNVNYRNSIFHTNSPFTRSFTGNNKNISDLTVENVTYINPATGVQTVFNTTPLRLLDETVAIVGDLQIPLEAKSAADPDVITTLPGNTLRVAGRVDLDAFPGFAPGGTVRVYVDRATNPVSATLNADGSFLSNPITLNPNQSWYIDRHYVTVNIFESDGFLNPGALNMQSTVYQVAVD